MPDSEDDRLAAFLAQRPRLVRLAYRHLGMLSEAEDVVQDAWLRFSGAGEVEDAGRLLSTIVTRLCLDRMKSARARREVYVGPWLPEPAMGEAVDPAGDRALDISYAVMRVLERLSPAERAAYFLHDLWEMPFEEVAAVLERSPAACRKLASRARAGLAEARARFQPSGEQVERMAALFRAASEAGDPTILQAALAEEVELLSDGGGKVPAALNVLYGAANVSRFLLAVAGEKIRTGVYRFEAAVINDAAAVVVHAGDRVEQTMSFDLDSEGRVRAIYIVRNPDKLARLADGTEGMAGGETGIA